MMRPLLVLRLVAGLATTVVHAADPLTAEALRTAQAQAVASGDSVLAAQLTLDLARRLAFERRADAARAVLEPLAPQLAQLPPVLSVRYALERGRMLMMRGEPSGATRALRNALALAERHEAPALAVEAMALLGQTDDPARAADWTRRALERAEQGSSTEVTQWIGPLAEEMGRLALARRDYAEALTRLRRAQAAFEAQGDIPALLRTRLLLGRTLRLSGQTEAALMQLLDVARGFSRIGAVPGDVYEEVGETYLVLGQGASAQDYFGRALAAYGPDAARLPPERLTRLKQLTAPTMAR